MKKILSLFVILLGFVGGCNSESTSSVTPNEITFFYSNTCPHCHDALKYVNANYPNLRMNMVNVGTKQGQKKLSDCARELKLGNRVGTPLFWIGDKYIMGWSKAQEVRFNSLVTPFLDEKKQ